MARSFILGGALFARHHKRGQVLASGIHPGMHGVTPTKGPPYSLAIEDKKGVDLNS